MGLLKSHASMLPRLEAEEALASVAQIAAGSGSMKPEHFRKMMRAWRRQAERPSAAPRQPRFDLDALAAAGVTVQKIGKA